MSLRVRTPTVFRSGISFVIFKILRKITNNTRAEIFKYKMSNPELVPEENPVAAVTMEEIIQTTVRSIMVFQQENQSMNMNNVNDRVKIHLLHFLKTSKIFVDSY
jgi:hypothetical protein